MRDEIKNTQYMLFVQGDLKTNGWNATAGASLNFLNIKFERFSPASIRQDRKFNNQFAPRITLMKKLGLINIYTGISKGFSPPTTSELFPTGGAINFDLQAENGINYDMGVKGTLHRVYFDVIGFR